MSSIRCSVTLGEIVFGGQETKDDFCRKSSGACLCGEGGAAVPSVSGAGFCSGRWPLLRKGIGPNSSRFPPRGTGVVLGGDWRWLASPASREAPLWVVFNPQELGYLLWGVFSTPHPCRGPSVLSCWEGSWQLAAPQGRVRWGQEPPVRAPDLLLPGCHSWVWHRWEAALMGKSAPSTGPTGTQGWVVSALGQLWSPECLEGASETRGI